MKRAHLVYSAYILFFALLMVAIFLTPFLSFSRNMGFAYYAFSYTCHQKISRSLCLFSDGVHYSIGDCTPQNGVFITADSDRTTVEISSGTMTGYKFPVCSRDVGLYAAMLFGGLVYPLVRKLDDVNVWPAIFLVIAIVPLGVDGSLQLVSEFGVLPFVYESTNAIRLITGVIAGFGAAFYAIPILMNLFSVQDEASLPSAHKANEKKK